ncbi:MAG: class I SAM-dependent methyltransferase [Thermodesulfobacteriota bacterium]|nr:class I SAM-dependent methyltransferase [Thermodesulfobacteriota bacterium]
MDKMKKLDRSETVEAYDDEAEATNWLGPEVAFGLSFKYINAGERILDIGIGTGLSSILFHKAGLHVSGMDISDEMLEVCRKKQFAIDLVKHDLMCKPYPYEDNSIDHVICAGVMNFFKDLTIIFQEGSRILLKQKELQ